MLCLFFLNYSPFGRYVGFDFGVDGWLFFWIEFQRMDSLNLVWDRIARNHNMGTICILSQG
jgi:hypothetical protein